MSKKNPDIKIPFIVKDILADNSVEISSVFTSDKGLINFERLKYLVDTKKIELLNAYIDKDHVVFTSDFNYIKKNKKVVNETLYQKIDLYKALTNTHKKLSKIFNDTAFELDVATSSQYKNTIYSKPLKITPTDTITVSICTSIINAPIKADVYFSWTNNNVEIYNVTSENLNRLTNLFKNLSSLPNIDSICSEIIEEYVTNGSCWAKIDTSITLEDIKNRCDQFGIYEEYHSMLQNRVNITKSYSDLIEQLIHNIKTGYEYDTDLLSVESLILYFALYYYIYTPAQVNKSIKHETDWLEEDPKYEGLQKERIITFCTKAYKYGDVKEILTKYDLHM